MKIIRLHIIILLLLPVGSIVSFAQFTISPTSAITVKDGSSLHIGTNLYIKSDAGGSGYLADQNTGGNCNITGSISIERYLTANGWHNTSSPVGSANSSVYTGTDLVFYYDETIIQNDWNFGWVMYEGSLDVMKGYDVYLPSAITAEYTGSGPSSLNTGAYSISVFKTDPQNGEIESHKGWNLVGNPYPSPVDWLTESGWGKTAINDAKYIWNPSNGNYTIFLGGNDPVGINGGTRYIPSNQGFWVQAAQNGTLQVNNNCRITQTPSTPDYYKSGREDYPAIFLSTAANGYSDETLIRFLPYATNAFDANTDAAKLFSLNENAPQIWTFQSKSNLTINSVKTIKDGLSFDLRFRCGTDGEYSIMLDKKSNLPPSTKVYLKDHLTQQLTEISRDSAYQFFHQTNYARNRFSLLLNPSEEMLQNDQSKSYFEVFYEGNSLHIQKQTDKQISALVKVYNISGQLVINLPSFVFDKESIPLNTEPGCYIVNIIHQKGNFNCKIFVTR
ncbi:MAG: T9SS type A sorting domain-containing protein [Bacteroidales bacterium]|nr:T9SS type A sorting domain-containing protein [Bacteroidales bacterium]MCF8350246.1 T9SS type A sorting domain-containing protein [Bacteroidales bacterium]MCF8375809.1 T9SS type A sorting domain-containing protein [Bacteroidales bacterium]MCF8401735.1 T9SS type A sorting domain-containing protein [Bacteroidales bacterium]